MVVAYRWRANVGESLDTFTKYKLAPATLVATIIYKTFQANESNPVERYSTILKSHLISSSFEEDMILF